MTQLVNYDQLYISFNEGPFVVVKKEKQYRIEEQSCKDSIKSCLPHEPSTHKLLDSLGLSGWTPDPLLAMNVCNKLNGRLPQKSEQLKLKDLIKAAQDFVEYGENGGREDGDNGLDYIYYTEKFDALKAAVKALKEN